MKAAFEQMERLRQRILYSHLRLVISLAKQSCNQSQQLIDIVQEGNIGLVKALDRFDSSLGHKFSTYATWWIRHEIMRALARQTRVIRIPQHMLATISRINRAEQAYVRRFGEEPTVEELAAELEMPKARSSGGEPAAKSADAPSARWHGCGPSAFRVRRPVPPRSAPRRNA